MLPQVYDELHRLAEQYLSRERSGHTLQPTALVHEAYLKLVEHGDSRDWQSKTHFQAVASRAMRQILVDHARRRASQKRGGDFVRITLASELPDTQADVDLLALDEAMTELERLDARKCRVVEMRFFGGLTAREAADLLDISPKTAEADWYFARAWLHKQLAREA
jgi:RNA polymerase sigma factor (TIGR02999 family)